MTWNDIKTTLKNNIVTIVMGIIIVVLLFLLFRSNANNKNLQNTSEMNTIALTDTINYYKCKNGELAIEKSLLVGDINLLEKANLNLTKYLENMKVKNAKLAAHLEFAIKNTTHDTCWIIEKDSTQILEKEFNFDDIPYRKLSGNITCIDTVIKMNIDTDMVFADLNLAVEDYKIKVTSNNPYLTFGDIYGIEIPEYEPTWCLVIGPSINAGYGLVTDFNGNKYNGIFTTSVGVSLTFGWNIVGTGKRIKNLK